MNPLEATSKGLLSLTALLFLVEKVTLTIYVSSFILIASAIISVILYIISLRK